MKNIKRELKNAGINPIEELSVQEKTGIAEKVASRLAKLNVQGITHNQILENLFDAKMYTAQISKSLGEVSYFSPSKTIYFDKNLNLVTLNSNILSGCIHYLQEKSENSKRIGLYTVEQYKNRGYSLNKIGISYICDKLLQENNTNKSKMLLKQILLITGEEAFLDSIFNNNKNFEQKFIEQTNSEILYTKVQNTFEIIANLEQIIERLNLEGRRSKNPEKYLSKINMHKQTINSKFFEMQWEIYNRYFSRKIELIDQIEEIKKYKEEIFNYNQYLEILSEEVKYTNFIKEKFERLNKIEVEILKSKANNSISIVENGIMNKIIQKIKRIIFGFQKYETNK